MTAFSFLIVCPLVFLAGLVDAIAGGGGLISLPAYFLAGLPAHQAIGTNKLSSSLGTLATTLRFSWHGLIPWAIALVSIPFALSGSFFGARLALLLEGKVFTVLILIILPITAFWILFKAPLKEDQEEKAAITFHQKLLVCLFAFLMGIYDGFYGPGTGTFLILLLRASAKLSLFSANGITKVINLSTNIAALWVYWNAGVVVIALGLLAACFSIAGNLCGAWLFEKKGAALVKPLILSVLMIFFIRELGSFIF